MSVGFLLGRTQGVSDIETHAEQQTDQVVKNQEAFEQCIVALLFIDQPARAKLTDAKVAHACDVDLVKVQAIRDRLRN